MASGHLIRQCRSNLGVGEENVPCKKKVRIIIKMECVTLKALIGYSYPQSLLVQPSTCHGAEKTLAEQSILLDENGKLLLFIQLFVF